MGYEFTLECPKCGAECEHVTSGKPQAGSFATAIAKCPECKRTWQLSVTLRQMSLSQSEWGHLRDIRTTWGEGDFRSTYGWHRIGASL